MRPVRNAPYSRNRERRSDTVMKVRSVLLLTSHARIRYHKQIKQIKQPPASPGDARRNCPSWCRPLPTAADVFLKCTMVNNQ